MVECHDAVPLFQLAIIGKKAQHAQGHNFAVQVAAAKLGGGGAIVYAVGQR